MAKAADAFRTISEVSGWLDTPAHVLRFWESKFTQVKPVKRAGGRRYYRPEDMTLLGGIKVLLHEQGMTIKGVQKLLREKGTRHVAAMSPVLGQFEGAGEVVELEPGEDLTVLDGPDPHPGPVTGDWRSDAAANGNGLADRTPANPAPAAVMTMPPVRLPSPVPVGLLSLLMSADPARLRTQARRIAPQLLRLQAVSARIAQRTGSSRG